MDSMVEMKKVELFVPTSMDISWLREYTEQEMELIMTVGRKYCDMMKKDAIDMLYEEAVVSIEKKHGETLFEIAREREEEKKKYELEKKSWIEIQEKTMESMLSVYQKEREKMEKKMVEMEKMDVEKIQEEAMRIVKTELNMMKQILVEKERQIENYKGMFEKSMAKIDNLTQKRDVASIGKIGESQFKGLAMNTFRDYEGFELMDVHSMGGLGDFHMRFKEMVVLVDAKLYTNKVGSTSRDKIKRDLLKNEHIHFAWLVSMDTTIERYDKAPFMFEWVNADKCICYINCLMKYEDPSELLRAVWQSCRALHQLMVSENAELSAMNKMKEQEIKIKDVLSKMIRNNRERETLMTQLRQNFERNDEYIRSVLNEETNMLVENMSHKVVEWWNRNLEECVGGEKLRSTTLWNRFKRDIENEGVKCGEGIDSAWFKRELCGFLGEGKIIMPKVKNGAIEIINYRVKNT
jgi:hypothetical protein